MTSARRHGMARDSSGLDVPPLPSGAVHPITSEGRAPEGVGSDGLPHASSHVAEMRPRAALSPPPAAPFITWCRGPRFALHHPHRGSRAAPVIGRCGLNGDVAQLLPLLHDHREPLLRPRLLPPPLNTATLCHIAHASHIRALKVRRSRFQSRCGEGQRALDRNGRRPLRPSRKSACKEAEGGQTTAYQLLRGRGKRMCRGASAFLCRCRLEKRPRCEPAPRGHGNAMRS